ncbi:ribosomal protein S18-alanine N-acetyltransferase [Photobacterium sp. DNB23_23_1]|uniref:[Ribosomal protein bS18]-alanine N-acetyltransferase n=1 Tax=Photobacterium pectinilyticum TaxID=2906793 RepID=A0ABT1N0B1_9GAMM|nr:ribosomal protein S18-alanine N-acetyltransferase [Photobacterium sp. ZSDE20]MCQ1058173.1 ribosomal protein S18-alanine N-acetyltransferase [Photobacterium sp. ZSDE20]MDD1822897.1 ribosomal protein S18-alanine N-acetyltransferase [Photobacterium sp. ZSDE20]
MTHNIVLLEPHHLDDVWRIEQAAHMYPWAESMIRKAPNKIAANYVLEIDGQLAGYCFGQLVAGEATLLNIAIDPVFQGKGYGKLLLEGFLSQLEQLNAQDVWLEVRASNQRAYQLYESLGFNEINRREGYYPSPDGREDALIMTYMMM